MDITDRIKPDGTVDWTAPETSAPWTVYSLSQNPSGTMVKRAAPGGAGPMLNLLYGDAMNRYLQRFSKAFGDPAMNGDGPAGMFHDSYEYQSDWAPDFFAQFEKRRGYKLQNELPSLFGQETDDHVARVKSDYRETISDILSDESIPAWTSWAHEHGFITREQAHGSPGNWLDIYAAADIPETEMFNQDRDILVSKFASSAAHVTGRNLVGAEAGTWVAEHFTETLADLKEVADDLFLSGANRLTFHGTAYSPDDAIWPGWCFYASTELNPRNALWHDLPALNIYLARVQSMLQAGRSDNDVLLYWPIYDKWHDAKDLVQPFTIHGREWLHGQPVGKAAEWLQKNGYQFDYVSDRQLANLDLAGRAPSTSIIVVPICEHIPVDTFQRLLKLAATGAKIIFENHLPNDVPGWNNLTGRRAALRVAEQQLTSVSDNLPRELRKLPYEKGLILIGNLDAVLPEAGGRNEPMAKELSIRLIRRADQDGQIYFVQNAGEWTIDQWVLLGDQLSPTVTPASNRLDSSVGNSQLFPPSNSVAIMDPISGQIGLAAIRTVDGGKRQVHLQLQPHASIILRTFSRRTPEMKKWFYPETVGEPCILHGAWKVKFVQGGPVLPPPVQIQQLGSWTHFGDASATAFAGSASYTLAFDAPDSAPQLSYVLDLGSVRCSARIKLNSQDLGTVFTKPYRVVIPVLKPRDNLLEIEVTGTSANRIRDLDVRKVAWKMFYDANMMNQNYKPFDASNWPVADQGLLGPVTLQRLTESDAQ